LKAKSRSMHSAEVRRRSSSNKNLGLMWASIYHTSIWDFSCKTTKSYNRSVRNTALVRCWLVR
jgi:hypothetical protein